RMTPDMISSMLDWLAGMWFPDRKAPQTEERVMRADDTQADAPGWDIPAPAAERPPLSLRSLIPDAPEEQWDERANDPADPTPDHEWSGDEPGLSFDENDLSADDLEW
ncbi:MAG: hypothetical protein JXA10_08515, partial [Anaerolineae bacterium]|nr:hypothetical protein [Anaerolineae bacterium]